MGANDGQRIGRGRGSGALRIEAVSPVLILLTVALSGCTSPSGSGTASNYVPEPATSFSHIHGLAVDPGDPRGLFVATHTGVIRGYDDANWSYVGPDKSDYMGFSLHPADNQTAWSSGHPTGGGSQGIRKSTDGGRSWKISALRGQVDCHGMAVSRADPDIVYCAHSGTGLYRTTNAKDFAKRLGIDLSYPVAAMSTSPTEPDTVYAGTARGVMVSRDGGDGWEIVAGSPAFPATAVAVHPRDAGTIYAFFVQGGPRLALTHDGGKTWDAAGNGIHQDAVVSVIAIDPESPTTLYASAAATIYKSVDGAKNWTTVGS
ncbi:MAG: hypothetical protein HY556_01595 [Euryarchaeota archaeon]|nr:hypothetical protein [Euryarchaeota archaeon]